MSFSDEEREAMRAATRERNAQQKAGRKKADDENDVLNAIAALEGLDNDLAAQVFSLVKKHAPQLSPKTWYGMPAWALDGKVHCFFQAAAKFKVRYATFGFNEGARLDEGQLWPTSFAITGWSPEVEARLAALLTRSLA